MEHLGGPQSDLLGETSCMSWTRARVVARAALIWLVAGAFLIAMSGCIFSPREPDGPPDEGPDIPWVTPTDTDKVLENLAAALAGEGISNYMNCLTEDFRFHVDPQDSLDAGQEGDDRYAKTADAYLEFFLRRAASVGNGLFPCGEHAYWDFLKETCTYPTHEDLAFVPREFLDRLWEINSKATEKHIRQLEMHFLDGDQWLWNRHASILSDKRPT